VVACNAASLNVVLQIGDPHLCSKISDLLLQEKGHYVQAINYPTVPIGQEKLRMAPTPHHTTEMIDTFIEDMLDVWVKLGIPIKPVVRNTNPMSYYYYYYLFERFEFVFFQARCNMCNRESLCTKINSRIQNNCRITIESCLAPNCYQLINASA